MDLQSLALTLRKDLSEGFRLSNPKYGTKHVCELMQSCWNSVPEKRPTFTSIKSRLEVFYQLKDNNAERRASNNLYVESSKDKDENQNETQIKYAELLLHKAGLQKKFDEINRYVRYIKR